MTSLTEESTPRTATPPDRPAPAAPNRPSILMVDDQPARLLTYEAILSDLPLQCVRAHSGEEALALLLEHSFALILLDVNMPGMDGFEVARHVRAHARLGKTPIIFVTGERLGDLDRLKGYEVGAVDYLGVPVVPEILRSKVAVLIELHHRRAELDHLAQVSAQARQLPVGEVHAGEPQLRALFEQSPDILFILRGERDAEGNLLNLRYLDANESALRFYERTREQVVGLTVAETFPERFARAEMLCKRALGGERFQYETEYRGRQFYVRVFAVDECSVAMCCTDITERRRTEHALANSERRFQALLENCPVGVAQCDMDGRFQYVNAGFCDIVGYRPEELTSLTWQRITHPDDVEADLSLGRQVLAGTIPHYNLEKRYIRKDGTPVWVSMFGNIIFDEQRLPLQSVAVVVDTTARKLADDAVRESRERLLLAQEAAGLGSFDWLIVEDVLTWDARARELWGFAPDLPLDLATALGGVHPDDRALVDAHIHAALDPANGGHYMATHRVIDAVDGKTRWIEAHGRVTFEGRTAVRMVGTLRDITHRVEAERSLRDREERFRELANNIDQIVWTCDARGQPTWFNDRWKEFSDRTLEDVIDESWHELVHPAHAERVAASFRACVAAGTIWEETFPLRGRSGEYRWFLARAMPIKAPDGTVLRWFGTNTDITAQRALQDALTEADRRKDEFLAMLAHELRNPVAPVVNVAQILARKLHSDAQASELVGIIRRQVGHLSRLLDDLLDVARITRGRIELRREILSIHECIAVASETVEPLLRTGNHRLEISRAPDELRVDVDRVRLIQCLTNLLNNAARYSEPGTRIQVRTFAQDGQAVIEVRDEGRGVAPDVLPKIFELFAQDQRTLDRKSGGLGIGLSVCKKLMEMHGGSVRAHSEGVGKGSTFTLLLPLVNATARATEVEAAPAATVGRRVFIVDDNADAADSIALLLQLSGHQTRVVYRGEDAVARWAEFDPDVVLLDIGLPGMNGYQVIQKLRNAGFNGHAIALSGYGQPEDMRKALRSGFDAHLVKPVEIEMLEKALAAAASTDTR
jgi:PAS domain S-box-containing protein